MERQQVTSTNIESIGYDPETKTLEVEFKKSGSVYRYDAVPEDVFEELKNAKSVGTYFGKAIKGAYEFKKISPEDAVEFGKAVERLDGSVTG